MKKFAILALAVAMVVAFTLPASAFDSVFGGYWRTRAYTQQDFNGNDDAAGGDLTQVDTRTRIYYTAQFSEDFKFVNKFEFDAVWGGPKAGYGDIGADGIKVEVKNSYADFNLNCYNFKIGVQPWVLARGFLFDDDFAGVIITYNIEGTVIPFIWAKAYEGGTDNNTADFDYYAIAPSFKISDAVTFKPYFLWATTDKPTAGNMTVQPYPINEWEEFFGEEGLWTDSDKANFYYLGVDLDAKLDLASIWFTGIYEMGTLEYPKDADSDDLDVKAYLLAIGASVDMGGFDIHGEAFYASGQDLLDEDENDLTQFAGPTGRSYYWSEIMGLGVFDQGLDKSAGAPGDAISNIWAANLGVGFAPMDKLKLKADLWYANLAEDNEFGEDELGYEIDLTATYKVMDNLNLDVIGAYLFAGDATSFNGENEDDPYEIGTRLSLSF